MMGTTTIYDPIWRSTHPTLLSVENLSLSLTKDTNSWTHWMSEIEGKDGPLETEPLQFESQSHSKQGEPTESQTELQANSINCFRSVTKRECPPRVSSGQFSTGLARGRLSQARKVDLMHIKYTHETCLTIQLLNVLTSHRLSVCVQKIVFFNITISQKKCSHLISITKVNMRRDARQRRF